MPVKFDRPMVKRLFDKTDTDGSGGLDRDEIAALAASLGTNAVSRATRSKATLGGGCGWLRRPGGWEPVRDWSLPAPHSVCPSVCLSVCLSRR
jgi:hypothetical protein